MSDSWKDSAHCKFKVALRTQSRSSPLRKIAEYFRNHPEIGEALLRESQDNRFAPSLFSHGDPWRLRRRLVSAQQGS